jgi:hypothetical protein
MAKKQRARRPVAKQTGPMRGAGGALEGTIVDAVNMGYRVIEEQILQGQRAAKNVRDGLYNTPNWEANSAQLVEGLVSMTRVVGSAWLSLVPALFRPLAVGGEGEVLYAGVGPSVESRDPKNAMAKVILRSVRSGFEPFVLPLLSANKGAKPITDAKLVRHPRKNLLLFVYKIPAKQQPGKYTGAIIDKKSGEFGGVVNVEVYGSRAA